MWIIFSDHQRILKLFHGLTSWPSPTFQHAIKFSLVQMDVANLWFQAQAVIN